ncbi:MAG: hypothetical protein N4A31_06060 [Rickettsiales bacterium]|nr:hypothetical protein [Rickettsiales bacterium]
MTFSPFFCIKKHQHDLDFTTFIKKNDVSIVTGPLYAAARNNDCEIMKVLIDHGISSQNTNWLDKTAIDYTTECKFLSNYNDKTFPLEETLF